MNIRSIHLAVLCLVSLIVATKLGAQSSLAEPTSLPGYKNYKKVSDALPKMTRAGRIQDVGWDDHGKFVNFTAGDKKRHFKLDELTIGDGHLKGKTTSPENFSPRGRWDMKVGRAKQADREISPDKKWTAVYSNFNVTIEPNESNDAKKIVVTTDGTERKRYGTGCWVYGEELYQSRAMWWSHDSSKLVYYEMDEQHMRDYYLTVNNAVDPLDSKSDLYTELLAVRYPVAGQPNPNVALLVFDLKTGKTKRLKFRGPADQYLYNVRFSLDGKKLLVNRTNRRQNVLDVIAVDMTDFTTAVIVGERQETWQNNRPMMHFLADNRRFVWETEKSLWKHFELRDMDGNLINKLTDHGEFPVNQILRIDESSSELFFTAFSDQTNPLNQNLHRVQLDGTGHRRLTGKSMNHTWFSIGPGGKWFIATYESVDQPATTAIYDSDGNEVAILTQGSNDAAQALGLVNAELFHFVADDEKTKIYGVLHKPANFDPKKKYPLVIDVYGGPESSGPTNTYVPANPNCEFGYVIAKIGNRGTINRGKAFESANYRKLGDIDIRDQADGVRFLRKRDYINENRVGIFGHSYGGYMSALAVLKYPKLFHVAVSGAPVTDWKNYDSIYTERYMRTPDENASGYRTGSCLEYVKNLEGQLLLVHGLVDDNVHPSNTWQLVEAFHQANKRFDLQVFPNNAHRIRGPYNAIRWEYFHKHLLPGGGRMRTPTEGGGGAAAVIE